MLHDYNTKYPAYYVVGMTLVFAPSSGEVAAMVLSPSSTPRPGPTSHPRIVGSKFGGAQVWLL